MNIKLIALLTVLAVPSVTLADEAADLIHQMRLDHQAWLTARILKLPKGVTVKVSFRHGPDQYVRYDGYIKYDDTLWVSPLDSGTGILSTFKAQAYAIEELLDVVVSEPV